MTTTAPAKISLNGIEYTWDGESWYETKTFATPPTVVISALTRILAKQRGIDSNHAELSSHRQAA